MKGRLFLLLLLVLAPGAAAALDGQKYWLVSGEAAGDVSTHEAILQMALDITA